MHRARLTRRLTAVTAATSLLSAAGLATGVLVGVASAQTATSVSPSAAPNNAPGVTTFTVMGSGFSSNLDSVHLIPRTTGDEVYADQTKPGAIPTTVDTQKSTATTLVFTADLRLAAPVQYDVEVDQASLPSTSVATCSACISVTNPARATITGVAPDGGPGSILVSGTNFARGAKLTWLTSNGATPPVLTPDPAMTFVAGHDTTTNGTTTHTTGYPSATTIKGVYTPGDKAISGRHYLRVTNLDNQASTQLVEFWQPKFTSTSPAKIGQGAKNIPVTLSGSGIRTGSRELFSQFSSTKADVTVGTSSVTADTSVTAPVSIAGVNDSNAGGVGQRTGFILGPDGGYAVAPSITVTTPPSVSSTDVTDLGAGAVDAPVVITGTGFVTGTTFAISGGGITVTTTSIDSATQAHVKVSIATNAPVGTRDTISATNPDGGTGSLGVDNTVPVAPSYPFTVDAGPVITGITSPNGLTAGSSATVTITGTGFATSGGVTLSASSGTPANDITFSAVTVVNATTVTATATVPAGAPQGPQNVTIKNTTNKGQYTCTACIGIDGLTISPKSGPNSNNDFDITLTPSGSSSIADATGVVLHKTGGPAYQADIAGTDKGSSTRGFDLTSAATGKYDVVVTKAAGGTVSCSACFTVTGGTATVTSPTTAAPAKGGQGAVDFPLTITGTNFSHGMKVTIPGVTVSDSTYTSSTSFTVKVTVPSDLATGTKDLTVTNADGGNPVTVTNGFSVVAAPTITKVTTSAPGGKNLGQGASNFAIAIEGTGFTAGQAVLSGTGITSTATTTDATHLAVSATVAPDATLGARDVTVTNTDNGGTTKVPLAGGVNVTPAPVVTLVSPSQLQAGSSVALTISGQSFQPDSVPVIANVSFANTTVSADGGTLSTTATVIKTAPQGARNVTVNNSDGGHGACTSCFTITAPKAVPSFTLGTRTIAAGQKTKVLITGTPGDAVQVGVKGAASSAYASLAKVTLNSAGQSSVIISPSTNSSYVVSSSSGVSPAESLVVKAVQSLVVQVKGHTGTFTGHIAPSVVGRTVLVYFYADGSHVATACSTKTTAGGQYKCQHVFASGTYHTFAQTNADKYNAAGRSSLHTNAF